MNKSLRQTRQKATILEIIRQVGQPLSAEQIFARAREILPSIALTTVYRNLEQLSAQQTITRLIHPDGITRYRITDDLHNHDIICLNCARTVEIGQCPLDCLALQIENETGFKIISHQLSLYGYCHDCRQERIDS